MTSQTRSKRWIAPALAVVLAACRTPGAVPSEKPPHGAHRKSEVVAADEWEGAERESEMDPTIPGFDPLHAAGSASQIKAAFRGKDRKAAKISIAEADVEEFATVTKLIASLPTDAAMREEHDPPLDRAPSFDRVDEEKRNVKVTAWIYAIKYEDDQDWHVIIGTDPEKSPQSFFNAEVSGLPPSSSAARATLLKVRQQLDVLLDHDLPKPGGYVKYEPFPVWIEGSLFYDIDHPAGAVGPSDSRPKTAWEIHPITNLESAE